MPTVPSPRFAENEPMHTPFTNLTFCIRTFGCQMNKHDSERVAGLLDSYGCFAAADPAGADIVIFMTCCVREAADQRLYGQCSSCKSLPTPPSGKRVVAVGGCIAQRDGERLVSHVDNVDVIFGTQAIAHVADLIAAMSTRRKAPPPPPRPSRGTASNLSMRGCPS